MPTFRTDDGTRWGVGKGTNLTPVEMDLNIWELLSRIVSLETNPAEPNEIASFTLVGTQLTIHMADGSQFGPLTVPTAMIRYRGDWTAAANYNEMDLVLVPDDGIYLVLEDHVAVAPFDASADDGSGNLLYRFLFPVTGLLDEAPMDGQQYVRQDGGWVLASSGGGGSLATRWVLNDATDAFVYGDRFVHKDGNTDTVMTLPNEATEPFEIGTVIEGIVAGAGTFTVDGVGVFLNNLSGGQATVTGPGSWYRLAKADIDTWWLTGDGVGPVS